MPGKAQASEGGWTPARSAAGRRNPWLIAIVVSLAAFMEVLDTAIANVALQHISGGLAVSYDEATWVITSYLVANAVAIPASGWFSAAIGRKNFYMLSVAGFTVASFLCGIAPSLTVLVLARLLQGFAGGGLQPTTQSMLIDSFPPSKRGASLAIFGVTVILAPTIGPLLGGLITDNASWRWIFFLNVPVGASARFFLVQTLVDESKDVEGRYLETERKKRQGQPASTSSASALITLLASARCKIVARQGRSSDDWFANAT